MSAWNRHQRQAAGSGWNCLRRKIHLKTRKFRQKSARGVIRDRSQRAVITLPCSVNVCHCLLNFVTYATLKIPGEVMANEREMTCQGSTDDNAIKIRVGRVTFAKWDFCNLCLCAASCYPHMMNKQLLVLALVLVTAACTPTSTAVPKLPSPESSLAATAVQPNEPALSATEAGA